jgi:hypothetical protein
VVDATSAVQLTIHIYSASLSSGHSIKTRGFLGSVAALDWIGFTELEVTRLAANWEILPDYRTQYWRAETRPTFTIQKGDVGVMTVVAEQNFRWNVVVEADSIDAEVRSEH